MMTLKQESLFGIGNVTQAMKARSVLREHRIPSELTRLLPGQSKQGCAYGISVAGTDRDAVQRILHEEAIRYNLLSR